MYEHSCVRFNCYSHRFNILQCICTLDTCLVLCVSIAIGPMISDFFCIVYWSIGLCIYNSVTGIGLLVKRFNNFKYQTVDGVNFIV